MDSKPDASLPASLVDRRWLWALRIGTLVYLLAFCVGIIHLMASPERPDPAVLLLLTFPVAYGLILWSLRSNPPYKLGLAMAVGMGSILCLVLVLLPVVSSSDAMAVVKNLYYPGEAYWALLAGAQGIVLVSAITTHFKLRRQSGQTFWVWGVRVGALASILLSCRPLGGHVTQFRRYAAAPALHEVLVLLGGVFVYLVVLWCLRTQAVEQRHAIRSGLVLAMVTSSILLVFFLWLALSPLLRMGEYAGHETGKPFPFGILLTFALINAGYAGSGAMRIYYLMKREAGDNRTLLKGFVLATLFCFIFVLSPPREPRHPTGEPAAIASLRTIYTAEITYASTYNTGFSLDLLSLGLPPAGSHPTASAAKPD